MANKTSGGGVGSGTIDTQAIFDTHSKIKRIVENFTLLNFKVNQTTKNVNENWVGKGANEFQFQYKQIISKLDDYGDVIKDIYDALVRSEQNYEDGDLDIANDLASATK